MSWRARVWHACLRTAACERADPGASSCTAHGATRFIGKQLLTRARAAALATPLPMLRPVSDRSARSGRGRARRQRHRVRDESSHNGQLAKPHGGAAASARRMLGGTAPRASRPASPRADRLKTRSTTARGQAVRQARTSRGAPELGRPRMARLAGAWPTLGEPNAGSVRPYVVGGEPRMHQPGRRSSRSIAVTSCIDAVDVGLPQDIRVAPGRPSSVDHASGATEVITARFSPRRSPTGLAAGVTGDRAHPPDPAVGHVPFQPPALAWCLHVPSENLSRRLS